MPFGPLQVRIRKKRADGDAQVHFKKYDKSFLRASFRKS